MSAHTPEGNANKRRRRGGGKLWPLKHSPPHHPGSSASFVCTPTASSRTLTSPQVHQLLAPSAFFFSPAQLAPDDALKHFRGKLGGAAAVGRRPAPPPHPPPFTNHCLPLFLQMTLMEEANWAIRRNNLGRLQAALRRQPSLAAANDQHGLTLLHGATICGILAFVWCLRQCSRS